MADPDSQTDSQSDTRTIIAMSLSAIDRQYLEKQRPVHCVESVVSNFSELKQHHLALGKYEHFQRNEKKKSAMPIIIEVYILFLFSSGPDLDFKRIMQEERENYETSSRQTDRQSSGPGSGLGRDGDTAGKWVKCHHHTQRERPGTAGREQRRAFWQAVAKRSRPPRRTAHGRHRSPQTRGGGKKRRAPVAESDHLRFLTGNAQGQSEERLASRHHVQSEYIRCQMVSKWTGRDSARHRPHATTTVRGATCAAPRARLHVHGIQLRSKEFTRVHIKPGRCGSKQARGVRCESGGNMSVCV